MKNRSHCNLYLLHLFYPQIILQQHQKEESLLAQQQESIVDHGNVPQDKTDNVDIGIEEPETAATIETAKNEEKDVEVAAVVVAAASS